MGLIARSIKISYASSPYSLYSKKELEIKNLSFSYSIGQNVLKGINFIFEKGRLYAIIGENEAEKSTSVKLLSRLYYRNGGKYGKDRNIGRR